MELELFNLETGYRNDLSRKKMGIFLKTLRKSKKMTQLDMSKIIQCAQGSVSKFEEGVMELSAIEMIRICEALKIKIDIFSRCYLDSKKDANHFITKENDLFKIPKKYKDNCVYNIRGINPLIHYAKSVLGEEQFNKMILNDMNFDPSYLCLMDGQLNSNFIEDLSKIVNFQKDDFDLFFKSFFKTFNNHGEIHAEFAKSKNSISAIKNYINNSVLYDFAYERRILLDTNDKILIQYKIKRENILESVVDNYHSKFLEQMATYCATFSEEVIISRRQVNYETFSFEVVT